MSGHSVPRWLDSSGQTAPEITTRSPQLQTKRHKENRQITDLVRLFFVVLMWLRRVMPLCLCLFLSPSNFEFLHTSWTAWSRNPFRPSHYAENRLVAAIVNIGRAGELGCRTRPERFDASLWPCIRSTSGDYGPHPALASVRSMTGPCGPCGPIDMNS